MSPCRSGRPKNLTSAGHSINVIVPADDFKTLRDFTEQAKRDQPGLSMGDVVRRYIRQGMAGDKLRTVAADPRIETVRRLRTAARLTVEAAREIEQSAA